MATLGIGFGGARAAWAESTVVISEFKSNPSGQDSGREYLELFNYGLSPVDLTGWDIKDDDTNLFNLPSVVMPPHGFLILVTGGQGDLNGAQAKTVFEKEWLGGAADPRVIGMPSWALGNDDDEVVLRNADDAEVFRLAYIGDEVGNASTHLTANDFSLHNYGNKADPKIVRNGADEDVLRFAGDLGFEFSVIGEPINRTSDFAAIKDSVFLSELGLSPTFYNAVSAGTIGSPLAGDYTGLVASPVPALNPGSIGALGGLLGGFTWVYSRRKRRSK